VVIVFLPPPSTALFRVKWPGFRATGCRPDPACHAEGRAGAREYPPDREGKMLFDCHLHSTISPDAQSPIRDMCRSAVRKGASVICFTEHYDLNPADSGYRYYNHEKFTSEIEHARSVYSEKIEILSGIEFSEPHQYPGEFEMMTGKNFDFILGSVHTINGTWAGAGDVLRKYTSQEFFELHYEETLKMVQFGGFDALPHMDFPRRFLEGCAEPDGVITQILSALIRSGISLELNSSPLRKGKDFALPSPAILQKYKDLGGKYVTLGSDAHHADEICAGNEYLTAQAAAYQLQPVIYRRRKPFTVNIK
jgi:histidinol-phosphatase (PHP family)